MDVGAVFGALTGRNNVKIDIRLTLTPEQQQRLAAAPSPDAPETIATMGHVPSWKLHRNPFWRIKHPNVRKPSQAAIAPMPQQSQPQMMMNQPQMNMPYQQQQQMMMNQPQMQQQMMQPPAMQKEQELFVYEASQDVGGVVSLQIPPGKKVEHLGIRVQFIGRIDMGFGVHEGRPNYDFVSLSKELAPPGILFQQQTELPFLFRNMDKEHESYHGRNVSVRYFIKVIMERQKAAFLPPLTKEHEVWVQMIGKPPAQNPAIKMEVGIEECLHIEFEYERRAFHLQDVIRGKIHFLLVRIKIKHMELAVLRRETSGEGVAAASGSGSNQNANAAAADTSTHAICTETQTLVKYEIMDGAPVKGETIPVRLSLRGIPADLTPTYDAVNNRFSVRYFLNLVLVDEEDRRYFKQQEIILWRKELG